MVAMLVGLTVPLTAQRAEAAPMGARTAYVVPLQPGAGVDQEVADRVTTELRQLLFEQGTAAGSQQPMDVIRLNLRNPLVRQALDRDVGTLTEDEILNPPTDLDAAFEFARALGLTTVLTGSVDSYDVSGDNNTATIDTTVLEYYVPASPDLEPSIVNTVARSVSVSAADERERVLLPSRAAERVAALLAATLLGNESLVPPEPVEAPVEVTRRSKKVDPLWIVAGIVGAVGLFFLISQLGGSDNDSRDGSLRVDQVRAVAEEGAVRVTWTPVAGAIGYNVYRRAVGSQPIRMRQSRSEGRQQGFTPLLNPETNSLPTVVGGQRTSFIDLTAQAGVIYEYAVTGVGPEGREGPLSSATTNPQAGASIGDAPQLTASSGNGFINLNWTASDDFVDGYFIFRRQGGQPNTTTDIDLHATVTGGGNTNYIDNQNVDNNVSYTYVVQPFTTVNGTQRLTGYESNPVTISATEGAAPQAPRNVDATVDQQGRVRVTWLPNPDTDVVSYEVLRRRDRSRAPSFRSPGGAADWLRGMDAGVANRAQRAPRGNARQTRQVDLTGFQIVGTVDANQTTLVDGPLPDGTYTYAVRAVSRAGVRGPAALSEPVLVNQPPAAPPSVRATGGDRTVTLTWQPVAGDVRSYSIYRSLTPITADMINPATAPGIARIATVNADQTTYVDRNLTNNGEYYYVVTAVDSTGAESDFGKGDTPNTGVRGVPHATPTDFTFTIADQQLSGNGQSETQVVVRVTDAGSTPAAGVEVQLDTSLGRFTNLPSGAQAVDNLPRQVVAYTDANGEVRLNLRSDVVLQAGAQQVANVRVRVPELPDDQELQTQSVTFLASRPAVIIVEPTQPTLKADGASTTNVVATVLDTLGQPVPNDNFRVSFSLQSGNGRIRAAGDIQQNPFQPGPATVTAQVVNGRAVAVYQAGTNSATGENVVPIVATVLDVTPQVSSQTLITLEPGNATTVDFGQNSLTLAPNTSETLTVVVKDALGNRVRQGVDVEFTVSREGVVTVPPQATTDANGEIQLTITAGGNQGGVTVTGRIAGTNLQNQLAVTVRE